jgi:hypothetical protein
MDPTNIALWFIVIALIAIVPVGCFMTRHKSNKPQV